MLVITYVNRYVYDKRYIVELYDENDRDLYVYHEGHHFELVSQGATCSLWIYLDEFPECDWVNYMLGDIMITADYDYDMCKLILDNFRERRPVDTEELDKLYGQHFVKIEDFENDQYCDCRAT